MKFSTFYELSPGPLPWPEGREAQLYQEGLEQLKLTEELGFDMAWVPEHHNLTGYSSQSAPEVFLAWAAAKTDRIRLGHGVVQIPRQVNHLMRVAERTAVLDVISGGRLEVGTGRGIAPSEPETFQVDAASTRSQQLHAMRALPRMWVEDEFSFSDEHYTIPPRRLHPKPVQQPHPPLWMAASQPASWALAAELGAGVLGFGAGAPQNLREQIADYRRIITEIEPPYGVINNQIALAVQFYCAETDEEAMETAAESLLWFVAQNHAFIRGWSNSTVPEYKFYRDIGDDFFPLEALTPEEARGLSEAAQTVKRGVKSTLFCVGSPATVREVVAAYADEEIDQLILNAGLPGLPHEKVMASLRLFAEEVMPEFSSASIPVAAQQ